MDDWNYTLWSDLGLRELLLELSEDFKVFTCSVGDSDSSFDFRLFISGELVREYVVEDPEFKGGQIVINRGTPLQGEVDSLKQIHIENKILSIARNQDISTNHSIDQITGYSREELEHEKFYFDENEY
jgi:hypothetical protein